jgi:nitroreductase
MDISIAVKERRSIRRYIKKEIPEDLIDKLIEALIWAPSAGNLQSRKFLIIKDEETKRRLAAAALNQSFIAEAPLAIVCCADARIGLHYGRRGVELYSIQDVSASIMAMMLVAHENELGTCWVGAFREEEASKILDLPRTLRPVAIVPVGYPSRIPRPTSRVSREEAIEFR